MAKLRKNPSTPSKPKAVKKRRPGAPKKTLVKKVRSAKVRKKPVRGKTPGLVVAVAGGTGLVGQALLGILAAEPGIGLIEVHGRRPPENLHPKMSYVPMVDGAFGPTRGAISFCCLGTTMARAGGKKAFRAVDFDLVNAFAAHCRAAGSSHFLLVSAKGAKPDSPFFYMKVKGEVESALLMHRFPAVTVARPTLLTGHRKEKRFGEGLARALTPVLDGLMLGPLKGYRSISAAAVARALVQSAKEPPQGVRVLEGASLTALSRET